MRTFLLTALGNSAGTPELQKTTVSGVDSHLPDAFVPVIGLVYLGNLLRAAEVERQFNRLWPSVRVMKTQLILLNGIWRRVPKLHGEIIDVAYKSHVVVADELSIKPGDLTNRVPRPAHLVTVSPTRERPEWIRIDIQPI